MVAVATITDFNTLLEVKPTTNTEILTFIEKRNLAVFVDDSFTVFYKKIESSNTEDTSRRRALQEVIALVEKIKGARPQSRAVDEATYESYQDRNARVGKLAAITEVDANQKVEDLLNSMIRRRASDLHIKVQEYADVTTIRMRVNGELTEYGTLSFAVGDALLRSLWVHYAGAENRAEKAVNNGSFYFKPKGGNGAEYMVRMTESPEIRGVMFVARIRDPHEIRALDKIGYTRQQLQVITNLLGHRKGLASINGPTNSGKSSTQSTMLSMMPRSMHLVEIGDPVETYQDHIAHFELRESYPGGKDAHLETLLGSTVRQDPDILALTEMRDNLTARAALQLASQGKFVITTMHTTDFVSCFERFQRMGLSKEDIVVPGFLRGLICQKLLPKLCKCAVHKCPEQNQTAKYAHVLSDVAGTIRYRNESGCDICHKTGIVDRVIVAEAVETTTELLPIIREILFNSNPRPFYEFAQRHKIINIHQHARERILAGEVDPRIAEAEIGRFTAENLLWLYPGHKTGSGL